MAFGQICVMAWGQNLKTPLVTDLLPKDKLQNPHDFWVGWTVKIFFCINLIFTFPLVIYPAHRVIENYLYNGWEKSKKRQWMKNFSRAVVVTLVIALTIALGERLDSFLPLIGSLTCTPIAFTFPAMFHYKCTQSKKEKWIDLFIIILSGLILVFCTTLGIIGGNS